MKQEKWNVSFKELCSAKLSETKKKITRSKNIKRSYK